MVRKSQKVPFESIDAGVASAIIMATSGSVKNKAVDPRKQIGAINKQYEVWITLLRKAILAEAEGTPIEFSAEEQATLDTCKRLTKEYLDDEGSEALHKKIDAQTSEFEKLKSISSSMKFKFSTYSFEALTYMINLMVRELLVFTCDGCLSAGGKLTKEAHMPWAELQHKMCAGLYMNTPFVYEAIHGVEDDSEETEEVEEEVEVEETQESEETEESEDAAEAVTTDIVTEGEVKPKKFRPKLTQYINNAFKEITTREPRFNGLLLGKEVIAAVNDLVYQVLNRYINVVKMLLKVSGSKTITEHLVLIATAILLGDDIHTTPEDVQVIVDLLQERIEEIKASKPVKAVEEGQETPQTAEAAETKPKRGKKAPVTETPSS